MHLKYFLPCLLLLSSYCCATQIVYDELSLEQIFTNSGSFVKAISDNKIYIEEDRIQWAEDNIFLLLNEEGDVAYLPNLESDSCGSFISLNFNKFVPTRRRCPACKKPYNAFCNTADCPLNPRKKKK
ncbi:MAG: hypothetical protein H0X51_05245 [Parachlamydiaceae bacterium]|nr:hypothetical protein [Parachlamydiaceae bacterium]